MKQLALFDTGNICCQHCRCFLNSLAELREQCSVANGTHEVTRTVYFVLAGKSDSAIAIGAIQMKRC